jgi:metallo-beta-lactamase class B
MSRATHRRRILSARGFGAALSICVAALLTTGTAQENTIAVHVTAARSLAAKDASGTIAKVAALCPSTTQPGAPTSVLAGSSSSPYARHFPALPPTRVFDNLYFLGDEFVGAWVLQTSQGLILLDAFGNSIDAQRFLTGDLVQLGLDPKQIKYVIVTHGHWDHFGGAGMLQRKYSARVVMGKADWDALLTADPWGMEREGQVPPKRDMVVTDEPMDLTLGDSTVKLFLTPGHSPGTVSALIPAKDRGTTHWVAMWGGNALPRGAEPVDPNETAAWRNSGLSRMNQSLRAFTAWIEKNGGAESVISSHSAGANDAKSLEAARARRDGDPNPVLLGKTVTRDYFAALDHCMQALIIQQRQGNGK